MPLLRLASACIATLTLGCGPKVPDDATTETTSASTSTSTSTSNEPSTTSTPATSTGAPPTTTGDDPVASTGPTTSTTTSASSEATATTELGPCVVDPANGICSAACDEFEDCCKCSGRTFLPDPMARTCTLAMGIVTAICPWHVNDLSMDGKAVPYQGVGPCDAATSGWTDLGQDGDIIIELCGQTCTDYLAGNFQMLEAGMFCESA